MGKGSEILKSVPVVPIILGSGGLYLIYKAGSAVGKKFGIIKDDSPEAQSAKNLLEANYLSHNYISTLPKDAKVYGWTNQKTPDEIATRIYESKGLFKDNDAQFWASVKRILYKTQAAKVAQSFYKKYQKDFPEYMHSFLNQDEMSRLFDYFNKLPSGIL